MREREEAAGPSSPVRVDVELFVVHPTMTPAEITAALGLEAQFAHCVGERRKAPTGALLEGVYRDTRWRHSIRHELQDQWFAGKVALLVESLLPHKPFLLGLRASGGSATIIIQFLGDGYHGDNLTVETLARLAELELEFGIECYSAPQA
jgi:hypothetical protein